MFGLNGNASQSLHLSMPTLEATGTFPLPDVSVGTPGSAMPPRSPTHIRTPAVALGAVNAQPNPFQQTHALPYQMQQLQMQAQLQQQRQNSQQMPPQLQLQLQHPPQLQQVQQVPQQQLLTTVMQGPHSNPGQGFAYQLPAQSSFQPGPPLSIQLQQQRQIQLQQQQHLQQQHQQVPLLHQHQHQHQLQQAQHQQHQLQLQLQQQQQHMIHQQQLQLQQQQQQQQLNQHHAPQPHLIRQQSWTAALPLSQSNNVVHSERDSKALLKLLEFGQNLNSQEVNQPLEAWQLFVDRFYSTAGKQKVSLVNSWTKDIKVFEISASSLAKCFHINSQSGVKNTKMALESTVEQTSKSPLIMECAKTTFISDYMNGTKVITTGAIKVVFSPDYKIDNMDVTVVDFVEYIPRLVADFQVDLGLESKADMKKKTSAKRTPQSKPAQPIPESVVNEFGITSKTMKAFETSNVKFKADEITPVNTNGMRDIDTLPQAKEAAALQPNSNQTSEVAQPTQNATSNIVGALVTDSDNMQPNTGLFDSTKRRFSGGLSHGALGLTLGTPSRSQALENNATINVAAPPSYVTGGHAMNLQMQTLHQSSSATGSPLLSPSTKPSVSIPATTVVVVKGPKRARNSSVASASNSSQVRSPVVGNASSTGSRSRKGQSKKELAAKRKGSVIEEPSIPPSTPGPTAASVSGSADSTGTPAAKDANTQLSKNSTSKVIVSPVSIPSPTMNPMEPAIPVNGSLRDLDSLHGSSGHFGTTNDSLGFDSEIPNYYAGLNPRQAFVGSMTANGLHTYSQMADDSLGSTGQVEESDGWASSLEFISDPKTLDMMGEFIFDGGFDEQDVDSLSGPSDTTTSNGVSAAPIASALSDVRED